MDKEYWLQKWHSKEIAFNQLQPNKLLLDYFASLKLKPGCRVFVPLSGKSIDMLWLTQQGYKVIGVEFSQVACREFFEENKIPVTIRETRDFIIFSSEDITIYCGDFFKLNREVLGKIEAVYDRAALIALPAEVRKSYSDHLIELTSTMTGMFLITTVYDQNEMPGPPFSVDEKEVISLFGTHFDIRQLYSKQFEVPAHLQARGLLQATEQAYLMRKNMKNDPLKTILKLIKERYSHAQSVFWAGSVSQNQGTEHSDLDLVIVFDSIPHAYREAFIYDSWPIDAFIHDPETLRYFCGQLEPSDGRPALIHMILKGQEVLSLNDYGQVAKHIAQDALNEGPNKWSQEQIDRERFHITDILDDIKFPRNKDEQVISAIHLFEPLMLFYFRAQNKWAASGKSLMRCLKIDNPDLALEFNESFENCFKTGDSILIEALVQKILAPYGGLLWDGFRSDAPTEWKNAPEDTV